jgi:hypothetical protein
MPGIDGPGTADRIAVVSPETAIVLMTATPGAAPASEALDKRDLSPDTLAEIWDEIATSRGRAARAGGQ